MRRFALLLTLCLVTFAHAVGGAGAVQPDEWHSEQPLIGGLGVPVVLGEVGDIECWSANRCALITAGNSGVSAGVYAYDGSGWYQYSTVCGGHQGRIAWTGPDEFWTISDQRPGEEAEIGNRLGELHNRSLCLFRDGAVVASFARPLGQAFSYQQMNAVACSSPSDCWFGGERLPGEPNVGAFHLHWDGFAMTEVPSLTEPEPSLGDPGRAVFGMTRFGGQLFESVSVRADDRAEAETEPVYLHQIVAGAAQPFAPLATPGLTIGGTPEELEGFRFAGNGGSLWALSGATPGGSLATPTLLNLEAGAFKQMNTTGPAFAAGTRVLGFAMEPGVGGAWTSFAPRGGAETGPARITRIESDGALDGEVQLPRPEEELSDKGAAGPIACPTVGQCWMATSKGWLFHLGGPPAEGPNNDPAMHQLVTFRPADEATLQSGTGVGLPVDNSGAEPEKELFAEVPEYERPPNRERRPHPVYNHLKQKVIDGTILQLSFDLHVKAHVQLIAKEKGQVVAKTPRMTLAKGHHRIRLKLDPKHWPTHLSLQVHKIKTKKVAK